MSRTCISASPIAVPSFGRRPSSAFLSWTRSVVGSTRVSAATQTPRARRGSSAAAGSMNDWARLGPHPAGSATRPSRASNRRHRWRGSTVASSRGTARTIVGRARPISERGDRTEIQGGWEMTAPRRPAGGEVGKEFEVREADGVAAAPSLGQQVEPDRERDEQQAEQHLGREEFMRVVRCVRGFGEAVG